MREFEREIIPMCRDEGMGIMAYGTLGQGKFQTADSFVEREKSNPGRHAKPPSAHDKAVSTVLEAVANRKGTSLTSVALAYCYGEDYLCVPDCGREEGGAFEGEY
jgi:aryl-alcohol dehydrogenase-like predicted oxidoreductase